MFKHLKKLRLRLKINRKTLFWDLKKYSSERKNKTFEYPAFKSFYSSLYREHSACIKRSRITGQKINQFRYLFRCFYSP